MRNLGKGYMRILYYSCKFNFSINLTFQNAHMCTDMHAHTCPFGTKSNTLNILDHK